MNLWLKFNNNSDPIQSCLLKNDAIQSLSFVTHTILEMASIFESLPDQQNSANYRIDHAALYNDYISIERNKYFPYQKYFIIYKIEMESPELNAWYNVTVVRKPMKAHWIKPNTYTNDETCL